MERYIFVWLLMEISAENENSSLRMEKKNPLKEGLVAKRIWKKVHFLFPT